MNEELDLYQHVKRPEWGLSVIVALDNDRMTFGFTDGAERTIKREHFHMMERVVLVGDAAEDARRKLDAHAKARAKGLAKTKPKKPAALRATR